MILDNKTIIHRTKKKDKKSFLNVSFIYDRSTSSTMEMIALYTAMKVTIIRPKYLKNSIPNFENIPGFLPGIKA